MAFLSVTASETGQSDFKQEYDTNQDNNKNQMCALVGARERMKIMPVSEVDSILILQARARYLLTDQNTEHQKQPTPRHSASRCFP